MTRVAPIFELEQFEYLPATAGTALVRIAGVWLADGVGQPALVVRTPFGSDRVETLPDSAGAPVEGAPWRAGFSLSLHVITGGNATFVLDGGQGVEVELRQPMERGGSPGGFDRVAAGRELGELRSANELLKARVAELQGQLEDSAHGLKPRQARSVAKAKEEAERERAGRAALEGRLQTALENARHAQEQLAATQIATRVAESELERVGAERQQLAERLEALLAEEGSARGANHVREAALADLREERDTLRRQLAEARSQAGEGARQAETSLLANQDAQARLAEAERKNEELGAKLDVAARHLTEAQQRAAAAEERAAEAESGLEYARAAVAAAVASEAGEPRAAAALDDARNETRAAHAETARVRHELEQLKVAKAEALEQVEGQAEEASAAVRADLERKLANAQAAAADAQRHAVELEARVALAGRLEVDLSKHRKQAERRTAELMELKRRVVRAEREALEAKRTLDRSLAASKRSPRRARPERPPAARSEPGQVEPAPVGPPLARRLDLARQEESEAQDAVERLNGSAASGVELVDAEAALERAAEERESVERELAAARESVERTARAQLKRSSRGALREATTSLAGSLAAGEEVLHLAAGGQKDGRRLVAATDRRLLVLEGDSSEPEALRYDEVESVQAARRGTLQVSTKRGQFQVEQVAGDLDGLVQHVNERIWDILHRAGDEATPPDPS